MKQNIIPCNNVIELPKEIMVVVVGNMTSSAFTDVIYGHQPDKPYGFSGGLPAQQAVSYGICETLLEGCNKSTTTTTTKWVCVPKYCKHISIAYIHENMQRDMHKLLDDVIRWKRIPRYWPFVRGIHGSLLNSLHKGQRRGALMFSFVCAWTNGWVNNRNVGDLKHHRAYYDVTVIPNNFSNRVELIMSVRHFKHGSNILN